MTPGRPRRAPCLVLVLSLLLVPGLALAQERDRAEPLTKSELVRLLVDSSLDQAEIADAIQRVCLTFEPDERDLNDLARVGASPEVLGEVTACGRPEAAIRLTGSGAENGARAGEVVVFEVRAARGEAGVGGLRLVLEENGDVIASTRTDAQGRARFRIPGGKSAGKRTFRVRSGPGPTAAETTLALDVRPAPPDRATVSTAPTGPDAGTVGISVAVRDVFGNLVSGVPVRLAVDTASDGDGTPLLEEARTGPDGRAAFRLPTSELRGAGRLAVLHESDTLAVSQALGELARAGRSGPGGAAAETEVSPEEGEASAGASREREDVPSPVTGAEDASAGEGEEREAETGEREALAAGRLDLRRDRPLDAVTWFRRAVERRPGDGEAWVGLGKAWLAAGEPTLARQAFVEGRRKADDSATVIRATDSVGGLPSFARLGVMGGGDWRQSRVRDFGSLSIEVHPIPAVSFRAGYESTLFDHHPALVRGGDEVASIAGSVAHSYGPDRLVTTELSAGRLEHGEEVRQFVYRLENELRLSVGGRPLRWRIAGTLGRWWDRDDWLVSNEVEVPVSSGVHLVPSVHLGETSGTALDAVGRRPATVRRGQLAVALEPAPGWRVVPTAVYGHVSPLDDPAAAGDLLEGRLRLSVPVAPTVRFLLQGRHQRPPFSDPFTHLAVGLSYELR